MMSTTYTGRFLVPRNYGVPALLDIAVQSARMARFAGAHRVPLWTVAHHLTVMEALVNIFFGPNTGAPEPRPGDQVHAPLRAFALLHDADEVATNDVPSLWKPPALREDASRLLRRVFQHYVGRQPSGPEADAVKRVDRLALTAECNIVGPPGVSQGAGLFSRTDAVEVAEQVVDEVRHAYSDANDAHDPKGNLVGHVLAMFSDAGIRPEGVDQGRVG